jgi:UDP-N-acetylmuramoyl-tripeptide--D-alanyl-D-alanine ligase
LFFALIGARHDGHAFVAEALGRGAVGAVVSRVQDLPADVREEALLIAVDDTTEALGRLAGYHRRQLAAEVIAVTGSNGKTTAKGMIHAVLSRAKKGRSSPKSFNNQIGVPLTLLSAEGADEYLVVEIGSNAPGEVHRLAQLAAPDVAVITGIGPAHLEGLRDIEGVAAEKASLLQGLRRGGLAAVNVDHPALVRHLPNGQGWTLVGFGLSPQADLRATDLAVGPEGLGFRVNGRFEVRLGLLGRHNAVNALAAVAVGRRFGLGYEEIAAGLAEVKAAPMRLEPCRIGPVTLIHDSYNSNPDSARAALDVLGELVTTGRRVAVLGDMRELGEQSQRLHAELGRPVAGAGVSLLVAVGRWSNVVAEAARAELGEGLETACFAETAEAAAAIAGLLQPGDVVLIKGSRAMEMERLMKPIRERFEAGG